MRIELIQITTLLPANIALPWVAFAMAALVKEVQRLIGEGDSAVSALKSAASLIGPRRARRFSS